MKATQWVAVNGIRLAYTEAGQGAPVLILHGNSLNSRYMGKISRALAAAHHVFALDSRGHGRSERGEIPYNIQLYADDLLGFCAVKNLQQVILLGYSDGANVALAAAIKGNLSSPGLIQKILLISPNYCPDGLIKSFRVLTAFAEKCLSLLANGSIKAQDLLWKVQLMTQYMQINLADIKLISQPVLLLGAKWDLVRRSHLEIISRNITDCCFKIIPKSNHAGIIYQRQTIKELVQFVGKLT